MASHLIQGQRVAMPVQVRRAGACSAMFTVPAGEARAIIDYSGMVPVEPVPGKALCSLAFVSYIDNDLGPYYEFAVAFLARRRGSSMREIGVFIHWLPVDRSFTLEAGRRIWGFPKEMAEFELDLDGPEKRCAVSIGGQLVVELGVAQGIRVPGGMPGSSVDAYTCIDGVLRRTPWNMRPSWVRSRPGGVRVRLGEHPIAEELARLGLPKAAVFSSSIGQLAMTFGDAEEVAS
ncbi:acetoacetate decarboxylase family protein [Haloechinothrix sp. LS1_15]|uniref:acetoacetate decarboxylase family protein n=1 Tax=Haloechinothrix sp. LS1_15 TaxID=2652248 RepID=UPI002945F867|nr:acetoacetate decarboxylase family protein [Haloechinothrix sp. LS1_15]MDV6011894.1 acetoacetate decarboxylase [Haloechinothrix sp. LS1_15]